MSDVAAGVIGLLDIPDPPAGRTPSWPSLPALSSSPGAAGRPGGPALRPLARDGAAGPRRDARRRRTAHPVRDRRRPADRPDLRRGQPGGGHPGRPARRPADRHRISEYFPASVASDRWAVYAGVLDTGGVPAELPPFEVGDAVFSVRAHRLGDGLLVCWTRHDRAEPESDRVASTEQLGNLGWGEWDLVSGEVRWSAQLYRIYERDPALGPLPRAESEALILAEDLPLRLAAMEAFERAERVDLTLRVRIGGRIKHLRTVADAVRDADGRPLRIFGIVQDVTAQETSAQRLAEVERQLAEQRRSPAPPSTSWPPGCSRSSCRSRRPDRAARPQGGAALPAGRPGEPGRRRLVPRRRAARRLGAAGRRRRGRARHPGGDHDGRSCGTRCARWRSPPPTRPSCSATSTGSPATWNGRRRSWPRPR